ncbi:MAG: Gfo/Idh/MocA family oxidoreductase [Pirellulales bacterium]
MSKVRWGILSTAKIGVDKVIPAMQHGEHCQVVAIASRSAERGAAAARKLGIGRVHDSYESLLADPDVDAVYIPLPNHLHVPWSIRALEAGKHVLVEKPIGLSSAEGQQLVDAAGQFPKLKVMEAFMYRHHPQWRRAKQIVGAGGISRLVTIQTFFSYYNDDPANIRNQADIGGGSMADIGCYAVSLARFVFDAEPQRVFGIVDYDPVLKVDRLASGILDFGAGTSTFTCGTQVAPYQRVNIFGTAGRVEIDIPFNAPPDRPCTMRHQHAGGTEEISLDICDQYTIQGELFSQAVLNDQPVPTPLADAVANMRAIERVIESGQSGRWA